jgi:Uma2 family endonuclease
MTQAKLRFKTIEDYLNYHNEADTRYELVDGVLVEMGSETRLNEKIALWLLNQFLQVVPIELIARGTQIAVRSQSITARNPDLMVLTEARLYPNPETLKRSWLWHVRFSLDFSGYRLNAGHLKKFGSLSAI